MGPHRTSWSDGPRRPARPPAARARSPGSSDPSLKADLIVRRRAPPRDGGAALASRCASWPARRRTRRLGAWIAAVDSSVAGIADGDIPKEQGQARIRLYQRRGWGLPAQGVRNSSSVRAHPSAWPLPGGSRRARRRWRATEYTPQVRCAAGTTTLEIAAACPSWQTRSRFQARVLLRPIRSAPSSREGRMSCPAGTCASAPDIPACLSSAVP